MMVNTVPFVSQPSGRGRRRVADHLESLPFPHYQAVTGRPDLLRRIDENGTVTLGRSIGRVFKSVDH
jgi:hypothetical protein